ncbi:MAG: AMP-binding protein, partial [Exiguobacterium chiriqhucha]
MNRYVTQHRRDAMALVTASVSLTWAELSAESARLAHFLERVAPEARHIGLRAANSADYVIAVHAIQLLGKVLVPLNTRLTMSELAGQIETADIDVLLVDEPIDLSITQFALTSRDEASLATPHEWADDEVMSLMFTSGTTGRAKAVKQTFGNHIASA